MEPSDESLALLARMSAKPGVQSTLILSRADGAILRAEGLSTLKRRRASSAAAATTAATAADTSAGALNNGSPPRTFAAPSRPSSSSTGANGDSVRNSMVVGGRDEEDGGRQTGEEVARVVWRYVKATEGLVRDLDEEDEVKLLRVRTKKNELVVVPSSKFLLVVVHDTPPA